MDRSHGEGEAMNPPQTIAEHLSAHAAAVERLRDTVVDSAARVATALLETIRRGGKIIVFGNGGSAAQAQHFAAELMVRFRRHRRPVPAVALTTDTSVITAAANDFGFEEVFVRQCEGLARPGDVVIGISTSGRSRNVLAALEWSRGNGCHTVAFSGAAGPAMAEVTDHIIAIPSMDVAIVQEMHLLCLHAICTVVEQALEDAEPPKPVLFVDRDGTLMRDSGYPSRPEDVELLPGAAAGLRAFAADGFHLVVVTNQSGISRGLFSIADAERVNGALIAQLRAVGVEVDAVLMCTHAPEEGCACRKPGTALFEGWLRHRNVDPARSWMVGDRASDIDAGRALGLRTALVVGGERRSQEAARADLVVERLDELYRVVQSLTEARSG
jgi:D-sedoheptulose 7-phosphate isomerase